MTAPVNWHMSLVPTASHADLLASEANPHTTLVVHLREGTLHAQVAELGGEPHERVVVTMRFLADVVAAALDSSGRRRLDDAWFVFQAADNPVDLKCVALQGHRDYASVVVLPDFYFWEQRGYQDFLPDVPPWISRRDVLFWRGSTTGGVGLSRAKLDALPRYRLARLASSWGADADVAFSQVAQADSPDEHQAVLQRLDSEGLLRQFVPPEAQAEYRYVVDIDGNASAWNLLQRLRLGACLMRVASPWRDWWSSRLQPWKHFVPVAPDLSDLQERWVWCREHPDEAERIAIQGRAFALSVDFRGEMAAAGAALATL